MAAPLRGYRSPAGRCQPGQQQGLGGLGGAREPQSWAETLPSSVPPVQVSGVGASQGGRTAVAGQGGGPTAAAMGCTGVAKVVGDLRSRMARGHPAATVAASYLGTQRAGQGTGGLQEQRAGPGVRTASDARLV